MRPVALLLASLAGLAGCGGDGGDARPQTAGAFTYPASVKERPEAVVLAWSDALNHGLNEDAGSYFGPRVRIVSEEGRVGYLEGPEEAASFNASIACQGKVIGLSRRGERVWAAFILDQRGTFACSAPGRIDTAAFTVQGGRIVAFVDLPD